jgi:uncharacterized membrane protein YjdF
MDEKSTDHSFFYSEIPPPKKKFGLNSLTRFKVTALFKFSLNLHVILWMFGTSYTVADEITCKNGTTSLKKYLHL